jgi:hypothetical protein
VHIRDVTLQIGLPREAHRAVVHGAFEDPLVGVLSQVLAKRLLAEHSLAHLALDLHFRVLIDRYSMQGLMKKQLGVRI